MKFALVSPRRIVRARLRQGERVKYLLLLAPCVVALWASFYNSVEPRLFGVPFFYWFQLLLVPLSALCIYGADRIRKSQP
jgi:hypothetical protein